ncbi:MAG: hypothetical protein HRT47_11280 [Candidatus Caenarcaniphilales bacterium]|nr:hypothetical protein [Candidatus Caenarcaniphilales bacterium]
MDSALFEFTKLSFENLNRHIRLADNKAKFILSLDLAIISGISAIAYDYFSNETNIFSLECKFVMALLAVNTVLILYSLFNTVSIINPRLSKANNPSAMLYWDRITDMDLPELENEYQNASHEKLHSELVAQIYFYSKVASDKYLKVRNAIFSMLSAVVTTILTMMVISMIKLF